MIELTAGVVDVNVQPAEYVRLLGYPRGHKLDGRALELANWARDWYCAHGRPWAHAHPAAGLETAGSEVRVDGVAFNSSRLGQTFHDAGAHAAVLVAVSAGAELEAEAQRRWQDGKPDEYFFLEVYGSAVVEHLITATGAKLCAWAEARGEAVLPHYSPGYPDWDIAEQPRLLEVFTRLSPNGDTAPIDAFESGMLRPKKSLLALFGVTRHVDRVRHLSGLSPCEHCSFSPCQYRRAPYRRAQPSTSHELAQLAGAREMADESSTGDAPRTPPLTQNARYSTNERALRRWASERLTFVRHDDGSLEATFRYDGTTCTNMGRPMEFLYQVRLGAPSAGYPILDERCAPAPHDQGHRSMCGYLESGERLMKAIGDERPLAGEPLDTVLTWRRSQASAGCYCDADSRTHKWGLVLETLHFALTHDLGEPIAPVDPSSKESPS